MSRKDESFTKTAMSPFQNWPKPISSGGCVAFAQSLHFSAKLSFVFITVYAVKALASWIKTLIWYLRLMCSRSSTGHIFMSDAGACTLVVCTFVHAFLLAHEYEADATNEEFFQTTARFSSERET